MEARKGNKVYQVDEREAEAYRSQGFDLYKGGKLFKHAIGKTVSIEQYEEALKRIEQLEAQLSKAEGEEPEAKRTTRSK